MAGISRLRVEWSGDSVTGPGLTTFFASQGAEGPLPAAALAFFTSVASLVPAGITWTVPGGGDVIDEATGALTGVWAAAGGGSVASSGTGSFARGVGLRIRWATILIREGRRVAGSTFLVPLKSTSFDTDGSPLASSVSTVLTAAGALITALAGELMIWSRPRVGVAGLGVPIVSATVPDRTSWLLSRRT